MPKNIAAIIPYNREGKLLLQHRTDDAPHLPGEWNFFGGGMEEGETPEIAAKRELQEELELDLGDAMLFKSFEIEQPDGLRIKHVFLMPCDKPVEVLRRQLHEGKDLGYFSLEEALTLGIVARDLPILTESAEEIKKRLNL